MDDAGHEEFHLACSIGNGTLARCMLPFIDLEKKTRNNTPLEAACWGGHADIVEMLIDAGGDVNAEDHEEFTCLHAAAFKGFADVIALLLDNGANIEARDDAGSTPFAIATLNGHFRAMRLLARRGANVSPLANDRVSPLSMACCTGSESRIRALLQLGADPRSHAAAGAISTRASAMNSVFSNAGESCLLQVIMYLWPSPAAPGESADARSAREDLARRHLSVAEMLIAAGADVDVHHMGNTALHIAAGIGNRRLVVALLRAGASPTATAIAANGIISSSLARAALYCRPLAARLLLHAGALENTRDGAGFRPIQVIGGLADALPSTPDGEDLESRKMAVRNALLRGPAFRSTAWLWPVAVAGAGIGSGTKVPSPAAAAAAAAAAATGLDQKVGGGWAKGAGVEELPAVVAAALTGSAALAPAAAKAAAALERAAVAPTTEERDEKVAQVAAFTAGMATGDGAGILVRRHNVAEPRFGECRRNRTPVSLSAMWRHANKTG